jgi:hypothetical protein
VSMVQNSLLNSSFPNLWNASSRAPNQWNSCSSCVRCNVSSYDHALLHPPRV